MPETIILNIDDQTGEMAFIYDDRWAGLLNEGPSTVQRASHVEPYAELSDEAKAWLRTNRGMDPGDDQAAMDWWADMSPSTHGPGPVLGPYTTRAEALKAEVDWINENVLTPQE